MPSAVVLFPSAARRSLVVEMADVLERYWSDRAWERCRSVVSQTIDQDAREAGIWLSTEQLQAEIATVDLAICAELERRGFVMPATDEPEPRGAA